MAKHTFFADNIGSQGTFVELSRDQKHHLFKVFRAVAGDEVELLDGKGKRAVGVVDECKNVEIISVVEEERRGAELHLVFALPRKNQLDLLLKQAAELGAAELHPVKCERSVSQGECNDRWLTLLEEACKQSKNPFVPQINAVCSLREKLEELNSRGIPVVFGAIRSETEKIPANKCAAWVVGPEGGFTDSEEELMRSHGAIPLNLGPWVLRLETAACAGLAVLRQLLGILLLSSLFILCGCSPDFSRDPFFKKAERARNQGNNQSALSFYRKALYRHPKSPEIYLKIATLCDESLDDPVASLFYYDEYLKLVSADASDTEQVRKMRDLVEQRMYRRIAKKHGSDAEKQALRRQNALLMQNNRRLAEIIKQLRKAESKGSTKKSR